MADDEPRDGTVAEKLAKLHGTKLRKQGAQQLAEIGRARQLAEAAPPEPSAPEEPHGGNEHAEPAPSSRPERPAQARAAAAPAPQPRVLAFLVGLAAGCVPAAAFVGLGLLGHDVPAGVPAGAVQHRHGWIHCTDGPSAHRWTCEIHGNDGSPWGAGEFVSPGANRWSDAAADDRLVEDGWHLSDGRRARTLYVRGVKISSHENRGSE